jgi:hypothetical protein
MTQTDESKGYYSLVQFVPDEWRGEGVNLGVVLLCPDRYFLEWRLTGKHNRARRLFQDELDLPRLKAMKAGLEEQLTGARGELLRPERLDDFVRLFRNQLQLTDLRPCLVTDPQEELDRLYARLVEAIPAEAVEEQRVVLTERDLNREFSDRLRQRQLFDRLEHDVRLPARYRLHDYEFSHAYRNGRFQVIEEVSFGRANPESNCDRALALATEIEDVLLQRVHGETHVDLVVSFSPEQQDAERVIRRLFSDRGVDLWTPDRLDDLVTKIERELAS